MTRDLLDHVRRIAAELQQLQPLLDDLDEHDHCHQAVQAAQGSLDAALLHYEAIPPLATAHGGAAGLVGAPWDRGQPQ